MNNSIKIFQLLDRNDVKGLDHLISDLSLSLNQKGLDVQLVFLSDARDATQWNPPKGLKVHHFTKTSDKDLGLNFKLRKFFKDENVDVVHSHTRGTQFYTLWSTHFTSRMALHTQHIPIVAKKEAVALRKSMRLISSNREVRDSLFRNSKNFLSKDDVILDGINLEAFDYLMSESPGDLRKDYKIPEERFVIGNSGPLEAGEDHASLLKTFRKLRKKNLDAQLLIRGEGSLQNELESLAEELGIKDRLRFVSPKFSKLSFLKGIDVFILTTNNRSRNFSLLQAMAARKPVIATKIGAHPDVVEERTSGYLVPCGFPERIESAVMRLNAIPTLAQEMGASARRHVESQLSLEVMANAYRELYKRLAA